LPGAENGRKKPRGREKETNEASESRESGKAWGKTVQKLSWSSALCEHATKVKKKDQRPLNLRLKGSAPEGPDRRRARHKYRGECTQ